VGELALAVAALANLRTRYPDLIAPDDAVLNQMAEALAAHCRDRFRPTRTGTERSRAGRRGIEPSGRKQNWTSRNGAMIECVELARE
jgi:hypothetical protein